MTRTRVAALVCGLTGCVGVLFLVSGSLAFAVPAGVVCLWLTERGA